MSTKSVVSDSDRMLRNVTIWMWLPAFPFLLAHGIMTNQLRPVLGIIPVTFSAISGLVHVSGRASLLHAFFVFRETFRINWRYCPHCHMDLNINVYTHEDKAMFQDSSNGKESYGPVTFVDQEHDNSSASSSKMTIVASASQYKQPRPSTDDETARLV
ncbi:uncharacterized protein CLAFUR5_11538 [Fulvia fulva]|uniref:Uncharacterized protein n=1 Tax=Passalora fulva TaxID=5499 RepID=A0A9Q8PDT3_PASFU|nr:uncharacterized protein CLAFUR5_11538 [Fulvia fulva]KAK4617951.1 hypothetical protein CLAFUR4_12517 [Fulvia fulva]KAK4618904.1 hypothetical protein CLAFUR0_12528 [Fulvia fulva]UJO20572.1 hypothetical protein CLAFUR5_11538 [Fulvia fulva]